MIIVVSLVLIAGPLCVALWVMRVHPWCRRRKFPWVKSRRRLSKPFYRWAFRQGKLFTADSIDYFIIKYLRKYLRKRQKLGSDEQRLNEESASISTNSDLEGSVHSEGSVHASPLRPDSSGHCAGQRAAKKPNVRGLHVPAPRLSSSMPR